MRKELIKDIYNNAIELEKDIIEYVKSKGGLVDCQPCLNCDVIYVCMNYGGYDGNSVEEQIVYAVRYTERDGLEVLLEPISNHHITIYKESDYALAREENDGWYYLDRGGDDVKYVDAIISVAESIEEYDAPNDELIEKSLKKDNEN